MFRGFWKNRDRLAPLAYEPCRHRHSVSLAAEQLETPAMFAADGVAAEAFQTEGVTIRR